jgi:hypothetical protein
VYHRGEGAGDVLDGGGAGVGEQASAHIRDYRPRLPVERWAPVAAHVRAVVAAVAPGHLRHCAAAAVRGEPAGSVGGLRRPATRSLLLERRSLPMRKASWPGFALQLHRKEQELAKQAAGELWPDSDFVFTTRYGMPFEPRNVNRRFVDRSARTGVRRIRLHDTRHTCGSLLAALNVHPRVAMQILRHSKIAVTMEVYTHVPSESTRRALRKLGKHHGKQDPK